LAPYIVIGAALATAHVADDVEAQVAGSLLSPARSAIVSFTTHVVLQICTTHNKHTTTNLTIVHKWQDRIQDLGTVWGRVGRAPNRGDESISGREEYGEGVSLPWGGV